MIVRDAKIADATELLELMAQIDSETDFMLFEPGERVLDVSKQKKMLQEVNTNADLYLPYFDKPHCGAELAPASQSNL